MRCSPLGPRRPETDGALNGRISFTSFRDGQLGDIWTMNPDGTELRKLTVGPLYDAQSDWSPDGQWIAFRRGPNASQRLGVWKMDLYGDRQQLLTEGDPAVPTQNATQPAWTPDGRGLLFRATLPPFPDSDVWSMDSEGNSRHLVFHVPGEQLYPSYSPDMSRIAFTTPGDTDRSGDLHDGRRRLRPDQGLRCGGGVRLRPELVPGRQPDRLRERSGRWTWRST